MTMASHRHNRPELSVIPDLRFEYSYLKSIGRYVRLERLGNNDSPSSRPWNQSSEEKLPELSVIPDLRFEYSYLKSIGRYVRLERFGNNNSPSSRLWNQSSEEKLLEDYENLELQDSATSPEEQSLTQPGLRSGEVMHIQWKNVIWFTIRDQIIAPFLQGALWGIASHHLTPISRDLGSKLSHFLPNKEGKFSEGLRKWVKGLIGASSKSS